MLHLTLHVFLIVGENADSYVRSPSKRTFVGIFGIKREHDEKETAHLS